MGYATVKTGYFYDHSFWHNTGLWRTDWQTERCTDGRTDRNALYSQCLFHTADTDKTRQDSFVMTVSAVWNRRKTALSIATQFSDLRPATKPTSLLWYNQDINFGPTCDSRMYGMPNHEKSTINLLSLIVILRASEKAKQTIILVLFVRVSVCHCPSVQKLKKINDRKFM